VYVVHGKAALKPATRVVPGTNKHFYIFGARLAWPQQGCWHRAYQISSLLLAPGGSGQLKSLPSKLHKPNWPNASAGIRPSLPVSWFSASSNEPRQVCELASISLTPPPATTKSPDWRFGAAGSEILGLD
jgi:hypothetical protein